MIKQRLDEVRLMQKKAGILKEDDDFDLSFNPLDYDYAEDEPFLNVVFDTINDAMRSNQFSEEDFDDMVDFINNNRNEIAHFNNGNTDDVEKAVQYIIRQI